LVLNVHTAARRRNVFGPCTRTSADLLFPTWPPWKEEQQAHEREWHFRKAQAREEMMMATLQYFAMRLIVISVRSASVVLLGAPPFSSMTSMPAFA
jgi:hypothetical protein